jgi:hypothetical protein
MKPANDLDWLLAADAAVIDRLRGGIVALNEIVQRASVVTENGGHIDWDGLSFLTQALADDCFEGTLDRVLQAIEQRQRAGTPTKKGRVRR